MPSVAGNPVRRDRAWPGPSSDHGAAGAVGARPGGKLATVSVAVQPRHARADQDHRVAAHSRRGWRASRRCRSSSAAVRGRCRVEVFLDATATHDNSVERAVEKLMTGVRADARRACGEEAGEPLGAVRVGHGAHRPRSTACCPACRWTTRCSTWTASRCVRPARCPSRRRASTRRGRTPLGRRATARRTHRVVAGDSLPQLAWREYGDATAWRVIAEANDIDDPMVLAPGTRAAGARRRGSPGPEESVTAATGAGRSRPTRSSPRRERCRQPGPEQLVSCVVDENVGLPDTAMLTYPRPTATTADRDRRSPSAPRCGSPWRRCGTRRRSCCSAAR